MAMQPMAMLARQRFAAVLLRVVDCLRKWRRSAASTAEGAGETEEFEPLPLGEEPVVAGHFGGDDCGGFVGREGVEHGGESEGGEGEECVGEVSLTEAGEAQDKDEAEGVGGHQGMEERGEDEAESARQG